MIAPTHSTQEQDGTDMTRLQGGNDDALSDLMERYSAPLSHFLLRFVRSRIEADDIAQETFVRVYQNRHRFDHRGAFSTWLYTIAANLARTRLRRCAQQPEMVPLEMLNAADNDDSLVVFVDPSRDPGTSLISEEWFQELNARLAALPETLRTPLMLVALLDYSQAEIATHLKCSSKTVEMRLYHARERMRADRTQFLQWS
jgi:RNA polymerase sigma factor (sigma-70 family)